jgi:outer membrane receptor protein involved in Fe transport
MRSLFTRSILSVVVSSAAIAAPLAKAQSLEQDKPELEEVIVTAVPAGSSELEASVSVSSLTSDDVAYTASRSTAEIFRSLPGIRAESSGGGGNANITVRGIPLATGGSKFMQIQEDGLPVLEFGDINFGNTDNFIRFDHSVARVESIRGGSASTFASNSPGGVINMISNTGDEEGGSFGLSYGLDYDEFRTDFSYGGPISDSLRFHVAGFFRDGEGVRETGYRGDNGGQIKFNLTKDLDNGFIRFYVKELDDRMTTYLPAPVLVKSNGSYGPVEGFDASSQTLHSPYTTNISTFDAYGNPEKRDLTDGIESKVSAFGFEINNDLSDSLTLINKFRKSDVSGGFVSPFTDTFGNYGPQSADSMAAAICASALDGDGNAFDCSETSVTLAGTGEAYDGDAFLNLLFDTRFNDLGNMINDFSLTKDFGGNITTTFGFYYSQQDIDTTWSSWPTFIQTLDGSNSQYLNITDANGAALVSNGLWSPSFLSWDWDLHYTTTAPYFNIGYEADMFAFDASVRQNNVAATGELVSRCCGGNADYDVNGNGVIDSNAEDASASNGFGFGGGVINLNRDGASVQRINYESDKLSYSAGGSFFLNDSSTIFSRYSNGARAVADRLLQIGGALTSAGQLADTTDGYDTVKQLEVGYKFKGDDISLNATFFNTVTEDTQAEITSGKTFVREYEATGLELEGSWNVASDFFFNGNMTWTDAEISSDDTTPELEGNTPRRQADLIYTLTPEYRTDKMAVGVTLQGSTDYYVQDSNDLKQDGYTLVHLFASWNLTEDLTASINVNNLTDEFVITESEEGSANAGDMIRARPLSGTSSVASFVYRF